MAKGNNLNVKFNGDASGVKKASKEAQGAVKAFEKTGDDALGALGNMLGVNTGKIGEFIDRTSAMAKGMKAVGAEGKGAMTLIGNSATLAAAAVAAVGVAAAKLAFDQLNIQAKAYESTLEGIVYLEKQRDFRGTYAQALGEISGTDGSAWTKIKEFGKNAGAVLGASVGQGLLNVVTKPLSVLNGEVGGFGAPQGLTKMVEDGAKAYAIGKASAEVAGQITIHMDEMEDHEREILKMDADIARYRTIASDKEENAAKRADAVKKAQELIAQKYQTRIQDQTKLGELMAQHNSYTLSSEEASDAEADAQAKIYLLKAQQEQEERSLLKLRDQANKALNNGASDFQKALDKAHKTIDDMIWKVDQYETKHMNLALLDPLSGGLPTTGVKSKGIEVGVYKIGDGIIKDNSIKQRGQKLYGWDELSKGGYASKEHVESVKKLWENQKTYNAALERTVTLLAETSFETLGEGLGQLTANLINGTDAWKTFANMGVSAFADMAVSVGKIAIQTGVATSGIKVALKSLNPYVAIAAGTALVALGTAAKTSLSNVANGSYSYSSASVASSSYSSSASSQDFRATETRKIEVTGTLKADGGALVAVLNNENRRRYYTQ